MRIWHRYLGFFLAGIMAVYSISGIVLVFRNTDFLKQEYITKQKIEANLAPDELGEAMGRSLEISSVNENIYTFQNGEYDSKTGDVSYSEKRLPYVLDKMTKFHKAKTGQPLYYLNIFFGFALLFFVISSFWMFLPSSRIFVKSLYFTFAGIALTLILLFV
ncbi:MAG: hypothetical protein BalsKO_17560 [Balneolaceae bacterium]